jgi:hypothetical protein
MGSSGSEVIHYGEFQGRSDVNAVEGGASYFYLDNSDLPRPEKRIRIQVTWWSGGDDIEATNVWFSGPSWPSGDPDAGFEWVPSQEYTHADNWVTSAFDFTLEPNPSQEVIGIYSSGYVYLDQVVIDTWCVPEPSTLVLLATAAVGLLLFVRRRR